jgi:hypothetical protein
MSDEWIEWRGGERPAGDRQVVRVRFRNAREIKIEAGWLSWRHNESAPFGDVIAYRIVKERSIANSASI